MNPHKKINKVKIVSMSWGTAGMRRERTEQDSEGEAEGKAILLARRARAAQSPR